MKELLFIAILLACPLLMMLMMRGGHGHGEHHGHGNDRQQAEPDASIADLRRRRNELDRLIEERERPGVGRSSEVRRNTQ